MQPKQEEMPYVSCKTELEHVDLLHLFSGKTPIPFKLSKQYLNRMWSTNNC